MKISVLGDIIDTESIYRITPIEKKENNFFKYYFTIYFFNKEKLLITLDTGIYFSGTHLSINSSGYDNHNATLEDALNSKEYKDSLIRIENLRNKIISYWNKSNTNIPLLEFEELI